MVTCSFIPKYFLSAHRVPDTVPGSYHCEQTDSWKLQIAEETKKKKNQQATKVMKGHHQVVMCVLKDGGRCLMGSKRDLALGVGQGRPLGQIWGDRKEH